tara:strand:- start:212 stop:1264 length:1053 start_codon:yes stop_codon:yes gene_type:complete
VILPRVGIIADDRLQQHMLQAAMAHFGFEVIVSADPSRMELIRGRDLSLDVWLIDINRDNDDELSDWLDELIHGPIPVLVGFEKAPPRGSTTLPRWQKRLYQKLKEIVPGKPLAGESAASLERLSAPVSAQPSRILLPKIFANLALTGKPADEIWVLGASLGGPGAVKNFLDALPAGLPVAFVYAQHIDCRFEETLSATIGRHSELKLCLFQEGRQLTHGDVLVAPITDEFGFEAEGRLVSTHHDWPGPYGPSIDQVILNVHRYFQARTGIILFSGMGNDGSEALTALPERQLPIWVQTPATCANASMPESALATGLVTFHGTPFQLANQLVNRLKNHWMNTHEPDTCQH